MKKILSLTMMLLFAIVSFAQDNDTSLIRKNGVKEVRKKLVVHAFENRDSCLMTLHQYNKDGALIYEKTDMSCFGWPNSEEMSLRYSGKKVDYIEVKRDGQLFSKAYFTYSQEVPRPSEVKTYFVQSNDSSLVTNRYFYNDSGWLDSTFIITVNQDGSTDESSTVARYNSKGELVQLFNIGSGGIVSEMASYEMNDNGKVLSSAFTTYGDKPNFTQIFFEYNQKDQMVKSYNTTNQKQDYFYMDNGLIQSLNSYNPEGKLEMEYIFEYIYY